MLYGRNSKIRTVDCPLAWLGNDRLLLDDVTRFGLHRRVLACKDEMPNQVEHVNQALRVEDPERVRWWMFEDEGYYYLWIVWKEG